MAYSDPTWLYYDECVMKERLLLRDIDELIS